MPSAGIVAVLVGVAIGAVLYYLIGGSEEEQQAHNSGRAIRKRSQCNRRSATERNIYAGSCSICLESLATAVRVILEPCGHIFHKKCIMDWKDVANQQSCPNCRSTFT